MARELEGTFRELGLTQYLDAFIDQGFDSWDTILDIQESDLDALGVKLGHRRKLQRRIANARGIAPSISLSTPKPGSEQGKRNGAAASTTAASSTTSSRPNQGRGEVNGDGTAVAKRKYRRHPKPDEHAPERPPSAYVLFSNKMREDLKDHNLSFTEIAKLVGENWQSLPPAEKEGYEAQANTAKESYHRDLAEYKKTPEYRQYTQYLQEFKERQAKRAQDASKRTKTEPPPRQRHESISSSVANGGATPSASSNGGGSVSTTSSSIRDGRGNSERINGSEPSPTWLDKLDTNGAALESQRRLPADGSMLQTMEDLKFSPRTPDFDDDGRRPRKNRRASLRENGVGDKNGRQHLPSLSDMLDDDRSTKMSSSPADGAPYSTLNRPSAAPAAPPVRGNLPPMGHPASLPPMLQREDSSASSQAANGFARPPPPPGDGSLPIHALLSNRPGQGSVSHPAPATHQGPRGYGFQSSSSVMQHMEVEQSNDNDVVMTSPALSTVSASRMSFIPNGIARSGLDGMSALLRAGEIVGRRGSE